MWYLPGFSAMLLYFPPFFPKQCVRRDFETYINILLLIHLSSSSFSISLHFLSEFIIIMMVTKWWFSFHNFTYICQLALYHKEELSLLPFAFIYVCVYMCTHTYTNIHTYTYINVYLSILNVLNGINSFFYSYLVPDINTSFPFMLDFASFVMFL